MYDPTVGRWTTEDPIGFEGGDFNTYRFVGNNVLNATDPTGLQRQPPRPPFKPPSNRYYLDDDKAELPIVAEIKRLRRLEGLYRPYEALKEKAKETGVPKSLIDNIDTRARIGNDERDIFRQRFDDLAEALKETAWATKVGVPAKQMEGVRNVGQLKAEIDRHLKQAARKWLEEGNILAMAIPRSQALKRIEGLIGEDHRDDSIEGHIRKLSRRGSGPHIRTELKTRLQQIEDLANSDNMGKKTRETIMTRVRAWRQRIEEIPDVE